MEENVSNTKRNFAYQLVYQILIMFLPIITAPYVSRVLGSENSGIYSYTFTVANYFVVFAMLGLEQYGNRSIARVRDSVCNLNQVFSELLIVHLIFSIFIFIIYLSYFAFLSPRYRLYLGIQSIYVFSAIWDVNWLFFGLEQFKITVLRNSVVKILSVFAVFLFVKDANDLWIYCLIMSLSFLISQIILWRFLPRYVSFKKVSIHNCLIHMKPLLILFIAIIAAHIYRMIDKVMLGWFNQMSNLGCYEYADKLIRLPLSLITALGTVMLSQMSNLFANNEIDKAEKVLRKSAMFEIFMSLALAFGLASISPEFVVLFLGKEYKESVALVMILACTIPLIGWNNFVRTQILIPLQKDRIYTCAVCAGAIVNFFLNLILINLYSARGAAVATIFSYSVVLLIQTVPLFHSTKIKSYFKYIPFPLLTGGLMFLINRLIGNCMGISVATVVLQIVCGIVFFSSMSIMFLYFTDKSLVMVYFNKATRIFKRNINK